MPCDCDTFPDLELKRAAISKRAKRAKDLKQRLATVAIHPDKEHQLMECPLCGALWQRSSAWNWGAKEYHFRVPPIETAMWLQEAFVDPDEVMLFVGTIERYLGSNTFAVKEQPCAETGCHRLVVEPTVHCLRHHIANLQAVHALAAVPSGRWLQAYEAVSPAKFEEYIRTLQDQLEAAA